MYELNRQVMIPVEVPEFKTLSIQLGVLSKYFSLVQLINKRQAKYNCNLCLVQMFVFNMLLVNSIPSIRLNVIY